MFQDNNIVITNHTNKLSILNNINSLLNIKIYTLEEFLSLYFFDYDEKTIYYIMNKYHVIYDIAKIYLDNMYYLEDKKYQNNKLSFLVSLKHELIKEQLLYINPFFKKYLNKKLILIYNLPPTKELTYLINLLEKDTKVSVVNIPLSNYQHFITELPTDTEEITYVATQICELVNKGIPFSKIFLTNLTPHYKKIIRRLFPMFNIPVTFKNDESIYTTSICTKFMENYCNDLSKTISLLEEENTSPSSKKIIDKIITIINKYTFIKDKNLIKDMIKHDLKNTKLDQIDIIDSIHESNLKENIFNDDEYVFIVNFNQGIIPHIHKDELYLKDNDKTELSISFTVDKNNLEKELIVNKISNIKNLYITYSLEVNNEDANISNLNEILKYPIKQDIDIPLSYSNLYNEILLTSYLDDYYKYGTVPIKLPLLNNTYNALPYNQYDNKVTALNPIDINNYLNNKLTLSYTSLDKYYKCPFSYYISKVLKLDIFEETFNTIIGSLFHTILEKINSSITFEELWQQELSSIDYEFNVKERFFLNKLKSELSFAIETIKEQESLTNLHDELHEEKIDIVIDEQKNIIFTGIIDKIKYGIINDKTIIAIIDYKTGHLNLDLTTICYGIGMQLPIYLFLIDQTKKLSNVQIAGFYLEKILNNEISVDNTHTYDELKKKNLLLQGYSNSDLDILQEFDTSYIDSKMIKSMKVKQDGSLYDYAKNKTLSNHEMTILKDITASKIKEGADLITNANFAIAPKNIGGIDYSCQFCHFKDLCYKTNKDIINLESKTLEDIIGGE